MQLLFDNGYEDVNRDGNPDLSLQGIHRSAVELFDAQVLFDPFEEQLDLPTAAIQLRDGQWWQGEVVGQKDESALLLRIEVTNAAQFLGIAFAGHGVDERNNLIADHACSSVYRLG